MAHLHWSHLSYCFLLQTIVLSSFSRTLTSRCSTFTLHLLNQWQQHLNNTSLTHLTIGSGSVADSEVLSLINLLKSNHTLQKLTLRYLHSHHLLQLVETAADCQSLKKLIILHTDSNELPSNVKQQHQHLLELGRSAVERGTDFHSGTESFFTELERWL